MTLVTVLSLCQWDLETDIPLTGCDMAHDWSLFFAYQFVSWDQKLKYISVQDDCTGSPHKPDWAFSLLSTSVIRIRIRIRIYLLARRNLLWDILRLPSSRRAALGLYVTLTLWRGRGANQPPYALLHRSSPRWDLNSGYPNIAAGTVSPYKPDWAFSLLSNLSVGIWTQDIPHSSWWHMVP